MDEAEKQIAQRHLPILGYQLSAKHILGCLLFLYILIVLMIFQDYGITIDEPPHAVYGKDIVFWYISFFQDQDFLKAENMLFYGGFFDTLLYPITQLSPLPLHDTRHLCNAFIGLLGIVATYRLGASLGSPTTGLLSALFLVLTPRFFGHTFNNPKDIPFATFYIWSIYYLVQGLKSLPTLSRKQIWQIGLAIGLTLATRVGGLILFFYLGIFYGLAYLWMLQDRDRPGTVQIIRGFLIQGISIFAIAYLLMLLFWPRALIDPIFYPFHVLSVFSNFTYYVTTFFEGQEIQWIEIPWYYVPRWLSMVMPEFVFLGLILGAGWLVVFRSRVTFSLPSLKWALVLFSALFPPSYAVLIGSPLGDGLRHFLFIYPPLAILSASGVQAIVQNTPSVWFRKSLIALVGLLLVLTLWDMIRLHPNQYVYFNRLFAGGLKQASKKYQTDYWENTYKQGIWWIDENYSLPGVEKLRLGAASDNVQYLLGDRYDFAEVPRPDAIDLYLSTTRANGHRMVPGEVVHTVDVDGVPLLYIIRPDTTFQNDPFFANPFDRDFSLAWKAFHAGQTEVAIRFFKKIVQSGTKDPIIHFNLAGSLLKLGRFGESVPIFNRTLELKPDYLSARGNLADALSRLGQTDKAIQVLKDGLVYQPDHFPFWKRLGLLFYNTTKINTKTPSIPSTGPEQSARKMRPFIITWA